MTPPINTRKLSSSGKSRVQVALKKFKCGKCRKDIADTPKNEDEDSIMCSKCNIWIHRNCTLLDSDEFRILQRGKENVVFSCDDCLKDHGNELKKLKGLEEKLDGLMSLVLTIKESILEEVDVRIEEKLENKMEQIEKKLVERLEQKTEEQEERERRKNNIILVQLPESQRELKEERDKDDIKMVHSVLSKVTEIEMVEISNPIRIGPKRGPNDKPRLLKVTIESQDMKKEILRTYHKKLNSNVNDPAKKIFINPDLTPMEIEREKKLRDSLKAQRAGNPDKKYGIRNNRIVELLIDAESTSRKVPWAPIDN